MRTSSSPWHQKLITKSITGSILGALVKAHPRPSTAARVRQSEAIELVTVLGQHMQIVGCPLMHTASTSRGVDVFVHEARSDDLALHSTVLTGQWKHADVVAEP